MLKIQEYGDFVYITMPLGLYVPEQAELEAFAFVKDVREAAPNPRFLWMRGQYVEADAPNRNGDEWTADELRIKSLTPVLCPVTVMHDLSTAVGTIADARLLLPDVDKVPRARIETTIAQWEHRFPDVAEECRVNAKQGTLDQSMECVPIDSTILTRRGFKRWDELRSTDETIGYDPQTGRNVWTRITGIVRKRAPVVSLGHGKWRVRCTRGHRWPVKTGRREGTKVAYEGFDLLEAERIGFGHQIMLSALADLDVPEGALAISPEEARVIGWIAGDGTWKDARGSKNMQVTISQSKPDGIMALELALSAAHAEYGLTTTKPRPSRLDGDTVIKPRFTMHNYRLRAEWVGSLWARAELDHLTWTGFVLRLSTVCRQAFYEGLFASEGSENHGSQVISQHAGPLKDAIALTGYLEGYAPVSHFREGDRSQAASHVRMTRTPVNGESLSMIDLGEQEVWCPVTELGSWTMQQEGRIVLTGNCLSPYYDCTVCGRMMQRTRKWENEWRAHAAEHADVVANGGRSAARRLRNVTFTGVGLIFGTRGARGALPTSQLEVEELAAMHREAHGSLRKRPRRKNTVEIEDTKYEGLVAAKAEADSKAAEAIAKLAEAERKIETLEAGNVKAQEELATAKKRADDAEEAGRVAAMKEERLTALGTGFVAKLDKLETTAKRVRAQAGSLSDDEWTARLEELEETLGVKRDAKVDAAGASGDNGNGNGNGDGKTDPTAGLLFDRSTVAGSQVGVGSGTEVTASDQEPTAERRRSVVGGLMRPKKTPAKT